MDLPEVVDELASKEPLAASWEALNAAPDSSHAHVAIPIHPPEVWACGVTYKKSAEFRDEDTQTSKGIYDHVYSARRPELFFKEEQAIAPEPMVSLACAVIRSFTAVEPELAVLIDGKKKF
jgi:2-dehydro-3-deoxy-D-arabinonate dehydratase